MKKIKTRLHENNLRHFFGLSLQKKAFFCNQSFGVSPNYFKERFQFLRDTHCRDLRSFESLILKMPQHSTQFAGKSFRYCASSNTGTARRRHFESLDPSVEPCILNPSLSSILLLCMSQCTYLYLRYEYYIDQLGGYI